MEIFGIAFLTPVATQVDILTSLAIICSGAIYVVRSLTAEKDKRRSDAEALNVKKKTDRLILISKSIADLAELYADGQRILKRYQDASEKQEVIHKDFQEYIWKIEKIYHVTRLTMTGNGFKEEEKLLEKVRIARNKITEGGGVNGEAFDSFLGEIESVIAVIGKDSWKS